MAITKVTTGVITDSAVTTTQILDATVVTADMAVDPTNASNLTSGSVPLAQLGNAPATDLDPVEDDIAVLGFQVAAASDLAKYSLRDQIVDTFQDATGVDASASTGEDRNSAGKYYVGGIVSTPTVTGGAVTTSGDYTFHYFTSSGNFITDTTQDMEVLLVAGGGGGGKHSGAGGGGGGLIHQATRSITAATHAYVQGNGGAGHDTGTYPGDAGGAGTIGQDSTFDGLTAKGGGAGGSGGTSVTGGIGGSGGGTGRTGGAGGAANQGSQPGDSGTYGFGFAGGAGAPGSGAPNYTAAGGGGAGAVGVDSTASTGGAGGAGKLISSFVAFGTDSSNSPSSGSNGGYFAGGGGGNIQGTTTNWGAGGVGGGARGAGNATGTDGIGRNGIANTGGGAGGSNYSGNGGSNTATGGSGTLIIKRLTTVISQTNMTLVSTATTAEAGTTATGDLVILYTPTIGSTVLNTNLKAYVSRDDGTTYTQATLTGKGSYSGTTEIATAHSLDISGQPAGVAMRWKIETLVQSAALETRLNGVSLGWS